MEVMQHNTVNFYSYIFCKKELKTIYYNFQTLDFCAGGLILSVFNPKHETNLNVSFLCVHVNISYKHDFESAWDQM